MEFSKLWKRRNPWVKAVAEFHQAFGVDERARPGWPAPDRQKLRHELIEEEVVRELLPAIKAGDIVAIADGAADAIVVIIGTCLEYGIPIDEVFAEVMRANMSKLGADGKPVYREDGKVMKGPNYRPPEVNKIIGRAL